MRIVRALGLVALIVAALLPSGVVRASAPPALLFDVEAGRDTLTNTARAAIDCGQGFRTTPDCAQPDTVIEPSIAVNPADPRNAVAVYQEGRRDSGGDITNGYATTFDGGQTWESGDLPKLTRFQGGVWDRASDAVVAFGPRNVVYANSLVFNMESGNAAGLTVNVSRNGGRTWGDPILLHTDSTGRDDKNWIVVDNGTGLGHHTGRVYVVWDQVAPVIASYSDDEGATWHDNGGVGHVVFPGQGIGVAPLVLNDGSLAVVYETLAYPAPKISQTPSGENEPLVGVTKLVISIAAGAGLVPTGGPLIFGPPITIATDDARPVRAQRAGEDIPAAAVDPVSGTIYVAWSSLRFRPGEHTNDIALVSSSDLGATWSVARRVNPYNAPEIDHWCPMIGVGADGAVHVAYRQRIEHEVSLDLAFSRVVDTFYQRSTDGGETFEDQLQVNTIVSNVSYGAVSRGGVFLGDYDQLAVGADRVYIVRAEPVQTDPREPEVFTPIYHHQRAWVATVGL